MRPVLTIALLLILLPAARAQETAPEKKADPGPYDGWTKEQFAEDRKKKEEALRGRAEAWHEARRKILAPCKSCGGGGKKVSGTDETVDCDPCHGTGGRIPDDFDVTPLFAFHYGHTRKESAPGRLALEKLLKGLEELAVTLPLQSGDIREIRIDGDEGHVVSIVHRSHLPDFMGSAEDVEVSRWIRADGQWWLLDDRLLERMPDLEVSTPIHYPPGQRPRPGHQAEAVTLLVKARELLTPSPLDRGQSLSATAKLQAAELSEDAVFRVFTDADGNLNSEVKEFPGRRLRSGLWRIRLHRVLGHLLVAPLLPPPEDYHLRLAEDSERTILGEGFALNYAQLSFRAELGEDGLPSSIEWQYLDRIRTCRPSFTRRKNQHLVEQLELDYGEEKELMTVSWKRVRSFWVPSKVLHRTSEKEFTFRFTAIRLRKRR